MNQLGKTESTDEKNISTKTFISHPWFKMAAGRKDIQNIGGKCFACL
jgi:hypothetical protein